MVDYKCNFIGRTVNAIGITYPIKDTIQANNKEEAHLKLYDKYEHIRLLTINGKPYNKGLAKHIKM